MTPRRRTGAPRVRRSTSRAIRADFPILRRQVHGKPLVYLDNAATTQKPQAVLDALIALLHRQQRQRAPRRARAERARDRGLRGRAREGRARSSTPRATREIIFTRNATEGINLVAHAFGALRTSAPGDEVVISAMEHHSNIVPWQMLCEERGAHAAGRADRRPRRR